jgi:transposase
MLPQIYHNLRQTVSVLYHNFKLSKYEKKKGRPRKLSIIDSLTLALYKQRRGSDTKKSVYDDFSKILNCSYKTFVVSLNRWAQLATMIILLIIKKLRKEAHLIKHIDSTDIPVCLLKNAKKHKTMRVLSNWGKNGKGFYYGLKLHLVTDLKGRLLGFCFTSGNVDDRKSVKRLVRDMPGIFIADAGYVGERLAQEMNVEGSRVLMARAKRNMKKLMSEIQRKLYNTRMLIELNFRNLKMFHNLVTSLPRSVNGYLANYIYSILSYVLR